MFQSTPPYGGRHIHPSTHAPDGKFQSTPPYGGRPIIAYIKSMVFCFNPRPRTGGDNCICRSSSLSLCFNPRPRTGGDIDYFPLDTQFDVSIHAPVRGATKYHTFDVSNYRVSIHAPVRGATKLRKTDSNNFCVSIHAPVRGATRKHLACFCLYLSFNPRPRTGGDSTSKAPKSDEFRFQSTPPYGGRQHR